MKKDQLLYDAIREQIIQRITSKDLAVHEILPTVREMTSLYQVSHITILHVLQDLRDMGLIERYGRRHRVCRQMAVGAANSPSVAELPVGLFLRQMTKHCYDNFFNDINLAIESELCLAHKYYLRSFSTGLFNYKVQFCEHEYPELLRELLALDGRCCGLLIDERVPDPVLAEFLKQKHRPAVLINRRSQLDISSVGISAPEGVNLMWTRARQLGYKHLIIRDFAESIYNMPKTFAQAVHQLEARNEFPDIKLHIADPGLLDEHSLFENMLNIYRKVSRSGKVLFWFLGNVIAYRFIAFMQKQGLSYGRDYGVCGYYMSTENDSYPQQLTTIKTDTDFIGRQAVRLLLAHCAQPWINDVQHFACPQIFIFGETMKN